MTLPEEIRIDHAVVHFGIFMKKMNGPTKLLPSRLKSTGLKQPPFLEILGNKDGSKKGIFQQPFQNFS